MRVSSVFPALFHRFSHSLCVLPSVVLVEVGGFDVGGRRSIRIVEKTVQISALLADGEVDRQRVR